MPKKTKVSDEPKLRPVARLDDNNLLVGSVMAESGIEFGDLPLNGSYKWDADKQTFIPLGFGFGKVRVHQPISDQLVIARIVDVFERLGEATSEMLEWRKWYNENMRRRDEENALRNKKR